MIVSRPAAGWTTERWSDSTRGTEVVTLNEGFEAFEPPKNWFTTEGAGFDLDKGQAFKGKGNAWVRGTSGWNAVNGLAELEAPRDAECYAGAWLRISSDVTDGYISVRPAKEGTPPGPVINEIKLKGPTPGRNNGYQAYILPFTHPGERLVFYVGLWGNGRDAWIQVDEVFFNCTWRSNP